MQLSTVTASAPVPPTSAASLLPREMQVARIGKGTVASEIDRSIRVRFEGTGPIEGRKVVPDSAAAVALFKTKDGATLEKAIRSFASIVDAHQGNEDLKTVTLLPDEHASKGVSILNWADTATREGHSIDQMLEPTRKDLDEAAKQFPKLSRDELRTELRKVFAAEGAKQLAQGEAENVAFAAAWNGNGNIVLMPDVSRDFLSTIGLYRIQPGDQTQLRPVEKRERAAKWAWDTALHETHHSISPMGPRGPEWTSVMEESVPEVLSPGDIRGAVARAQADCSLTARPARDTRHEAVDWPAWNRQHLPQAPKDQVETAKGRYTDGPALLRELLQMAGIDRRTTAGKAEALDLLQKRSASYVPRRVADAIVAEHGLASDKAPALADLIRKATIGKATLGEIKDFLGL
ncbi:MAG: hypothetical protein JWL76_2341 [Thermoleophilia bacterium]|nr:hypothetical protein [Thermoleophilia bacterium]